MACNYVNRAVGALGEATKQGTSFVFGYLGGGATPFDVSNPKLLATFAFQVLPLVIVMSALSALLVVLAHPADRDQGHFHHL